MEIHGARVGLGLKPVAGAVHGATFLVAYSSVFPAFCTCSFQGWMSSAQASCRARFEEISVKDHLRKELLFREYLVQARGVNVEFFTAKFGRQFVWSGPNKGSYSGCILNTIGYLTQSRYPYLMDIADVPFFNLLPLDQRVECDNQRREPLDEVFRSEVSEVDHPEVTKIKQKLRTPLIDVSNSLYLSENFSAPLRC